jgi:hypothetical protein
LTASDPQIRLLHLRYLILRWLIPRRLIPRRLHLRRLIRRFLVGRILVGQILVGLIPVRRPFCFLLPYYYRYAPTLEEETIDWNQNMMIAVSHL